MMDDAYCSLPTCLEGPQMNAMLGERADPECCFLPSNMIITWLIIQKNSSVCAGNRVVQSLICHFTVLVVLTL